MTISKAFCTESVSTVRLRDGRSLGYLEIGKREGTPIFHFHGHGSSRLEVLPLAEKAASRGIRLIAVDRPGIGGSDPKKGSILRTWHDDVAEIADQLGIERFAIEGVSAGGLYALACASKIPARLTACGLISSQAPGDLICRSGPLWMRTLWSFAVRFPRAFRSYLRLVSPDPVPDLAAVEKRLLLMSSWVAKADQRILEVSSPRSCLARAMVESRRQGGFANRQEAVELISPWDFQIKQITFEKVFLWHGEQDRVMPVGPARCLAQTLPHCSATFFTDEGHFSVLMNQEQNIFRALST